MTQDTKNSVPPRSGRRRSAGRTVALATLAVFVIGCDTQPEPVAPPPPPPTPEERFEKIVSALEENLSDNGFGTADAISDYNAPAGTPITAAEVEVKHSLTPPEGEGGVHRAQLCLITKAKVIVTLPSSSDDDEKDDAEEKPARRRPAPADESLEGLPPMESLVVPSRKEAASRLGNSGVHEIDPGVSQRCFDLEYRDDKWVLVSEVDDKNEPFNALAIEYALSRQ